MTAGSTSDRKGRGVNLELEVGMAIFHLGS